MAEEAKEKVRTYHDVRSMLYETEEKRVSLFRPGEKVSESQIKWINIIGFVSMQIYPEGLVSEEYPDIFVSFLEPLTCIEDEKGIDCGTKEFLKKYGRWRVGLESLQEYYERLKKGKS
jgi:hypothetical protein